MLRAQPATHAAHALHVCRCCSSEQGCSVLPSNLLTFSNDARDLETPGWLMLRAEPAARQLPDLATRLKTTSWDSVKGSCVEASSTYRLGPLPLCSAYHQACEPWQRTNMVTALTVSKESE